jgi:hypothetical protein
MSSSWLMWVGPQARLPVATIGVRAAIEAHSYTAPRPAGLNHTRPSMVEQA